MTKSYCFIDMNLPVTNKQEVAVNRIDETENNKFVVGIILEKLSTEL